MRRTSPLNPPTASQRQLRVGEVIRHALAELLQRGEVADPDLTGLFVTVPEVRMTPDLKLATVLVVPLGGEGGDKLIAALERHQRFLRGRVAKAVNLRFAPELRFRLDTRFEDDRRIDKLLHSSRVEGDLGPAGGGEDSQ